MVNNTIIKVIPSYKMTGNALANARKEYNQFVDDIVKSVPSGLSDIEKALMCMTILLPIMNMIWIWK